MYTTDVLTDERREGIAAIVTELGSATNEGLAQRFGVTRMTIYRDLRMLETDGRVRRVRGGAVAVDDGGSEPLFESKRTRHAAAKDAIARYVARSFVHDDDALFVEAGTTAAAVLKHLAGRSLTVMSNGLETLTEAAKLLPEATVMSPGGILRERSYTFVGPQAERSVREMHARLFIMGCTSFTLEDGMTDPNPLEVQMKRTMAEAAGETIVVIDGSKFGHRSMLQILPLTSVRALVTDDQAPASDVARLEERGVDVRVVPMAEGHG